MDIKKLLSILFAIAVIIFAIIAKTSDIEESSEPVLLPASATISSQVDELRRLTV